MINRCVCFNKTFKEILNESYIQNIKTLEEIKSKLNTCNKCKLCNPYIEQGLRTGQTEFKIL